MSDPDAGTGFAGGGEVLKSNELGAAVRVYTMHADERTMYYTVLSTAGAPTDPSGGAAGTGVATAYAGDFDPFIAGDPGVGCASTAPNGVGSVADSGLVHVAISSNADADSNYFSCSRDPSLYALPSKLAVMSPRGPLSGRGHGNVNAMLPPSPAPQFVPAILVGNRAIRGRLRGVYVPCNDWVTSGGAPVGSRHSVLGALRPLSLAVLAGNANQSGTNTDTPGRLFVERTIPWDDL